MINLVNGQCQADFANAASLPPNSRIQNPQSLEMTKQLITHPTSIHKKQTKPISNREPL